MENQLYLFTISSSLNNSGLSIRGGTSWYMVFWYTNISPDFKECCIRYSLNYSNFNKVPPVNSEVLQVLLVHLKNIESPDKYKILSKVKNIKIVLPSCTV